MMFDWVKSAFRSVFSTTPKLPVVTASSLAPYVRGVDYDGEKFPGGLGAIDLVSMDYWALRARSAQLFRTNLYARGIIRRMVTNEINTGLHLECTPEEKILGKEEDALADWSEDVENRFSLWQADSWLCDHQERMTFGALQALARMEALVSGDVLVVLRQHRETGLPRVQLINGACVQSPFDKVKLAVGNRICHGVELDSMDRQVAYWVTQRDGTSKRLPAWGEKSGRRLAWLVYGTDKRLDDVRGEPVLSLVMQSLKEIDRYRDSIQRKAVVLSMLAMFVKKGEDKPGTRPLAGGALRRGVDAAQDSEGKKRHFRSAEMIPGLVIDELQHGEEPHAFQHNGAYEKFGEFEEAIVQAFAWALEIPPEILRLSFSSNYSASQAAINEYKMALNKLRTTFGESFCQPIYVEWIISAALTGKIRADGLVESWRDTKQYDVFAAWTHADWAGNIKPAVDMSKLVRGYKEQVAEGFMTRDRATREINGTKFSKNVQKLKRENEMLAEAMRPLKELEASVKAQPVQSSDSIDDIDVDVVDDDEPEEPKQHALVHVLPVR
jgi:lambda family phage portal protein